MSVLQPVCILLNLSSIQTALHLYIKSLQHLPTVTPPEPGTHYQDTSHLPALHDVCR